MYREIYGEFTEKILNWTPQYILDTKTPLQAQLGSLQIGNIAPIIYFVCRVRGD